MINLKNKTKISTITLILVLTISAILIALPLANAHDPPKNIKTYAFVSAAPDPVGVDQQILIFMWLDKVPPTAIGPHGDRWENYAIELTAPEGSKVNLGPFNSDPSGKHVIYYTPEKIGIWTLKFSYPGQTIENKNPSPPLPPGYFDARRMEYVGDYFEPSSIEITFEVQEEPIGTFKEGPLPTDEYWFRPINEQHWGWSQISGNVLEFPRRYGVTQVPQYNPYTTAPESSHILWTREFTIGGLIGGEYGQHSYHSGAAYEGKFVTGSIINGILYYNKYPQDLKYHPPATYAAPGPKPGYYAVDLRTGEEIYYNNDTRISFGQVYWYASPNQHGAFAYLWKIPELEFRRDPDPNWYCYDAYTGDLVYTVENPPSKEYSFGVQAGTRSYGPNGEILQYLVNTKDHWMALWNNAAIPELQAGEDYYAWMWRPWGKTVDGSKGYVWNVTIPEEVTGEVQHVLSDRIIGQSGLLSLVGFGAEVNNFTIWALSTKPGEEGTLLWKKSYDLPDLDAMASMSNNAVSEEHKLFTIYVAESRKFYAYSTETGELLYETEPQNPWDYYYETHSYIAYDRLYSCGMDGTVYCYDVTNGELLWKYEVPNPNAETINYGPNYPERLNIFADGKIYISSTIHSPLNPKFRGAPFICLNATSGEPIWQTSLFRCGWGCEPLIADGIIVALDNYDNRIYAFGRGPSKTTVTAPHTAIPIGSSVLIKGTVLDQSPGTDDYDFTARYPNGVPAISDEDMDEWMEHLYKQFECPADVQGVKVFLKILDPNGEWYSATVTTDRNGRFSHMWAPSIVGEYKVTAMFEGSESYYPSEETTVFGVDPETTTEYPYVPSAEEIADTTVSKLPAYPDVPTAEEIAADSAQRTINMLPQYPDTTCPEIPAYLTIDLVIIAAVAIAVIIGIVSYLALKKQK